MKNDNCKHEFTSEKDAVTFCKKCGMFAYNNHKKSFSLTEPELLELLKEQRKICAWKSVALNGHDSSEMLDIIYDKVANCETPDIKKALK